MGGIIEYLSFGDGLTPLSMMSSIFTDFATHARIPIFLKPRMGLLGTQRAAFDSRKLGKASSDLGDRCLFLLVRKFCLAAGSLGDPRNEMITLDQPDRIKARVF